MRWDTVACGATAQAVSSNWRSALFVRVRAGAPVESLGSQYNLNLLSQRLMEFVPVADKRRKAFIEVLYGKGADGQRQ